MDNLYDSIRAYADGLPPDAAGKLINAAVIEAERIMAGRAVTIQAQVKTQPKARPIRTGGSPFYTLLVT